MHLHRVSRRMSHTSSVPWCAATSLALMLLATACGDGGGTQPTDCLAEQQPDDHVRDTGRCRHGGSDRYGYDHGDRR